MACESRAGNMIEKHHVRMRRPVKSGRCRCGNADATGERCVYEAVMLARLVREAKEPEKDECAGDDQPAEHLEPIVAVHILLPYESWHLDDSGIVAVHVLPADPRADAHLRIVDDHIRPDRNGSQNLDGRKGHQAEVAATVEVAVGRNELFELSFTFVERVNRQDCDESATGSRGKRQTRIHTTINERYATDRHGPSIKQIERLRYQNDRIDWPEILKYVVAMS